MKGFAMRLEPSVVRWVIDSSGMDRDTVAQRTGVDRSLVDEWADTGVMEYSKMGRLAKCVKRPEAALFLRSPPDGEELADYRAARPGLSPADRIAVRRARYAQSAAREMMKDGGDSTMPRIGRGATADGSAEDAAGRERGRLGLGGPARGGGPRSLYRGLRDAIESLNILVFQLPMDVREVRGLALTGTTPYAILVNSRDTEAGRTSAILHEYGHVRLRSGGICGGQPGTGAPGTAMRRTESWCNRFAASLLMPGDGPAAERRRRGGLRRDLGRDVEEAAKRPWAEGCAAGAGAAGRPGADRKSPLQTAACRRVPAARGGAGGIPPFVDVRISQMGRKFVRLVLSSYDRGLINARNAIDFLGMDARHFDGLRARVRMCG